MASTFMENSYNQNLIYTLNYQQNTPFVLDKHLLSIYKILTASVSKITYIKNLTITLELPQKLNNVNSRIFELTANGGSPI